MCKCGVGGVTPINHVGPFFLAAGFAKFASPLFWVDGQILGKILSTVSGGTIDSFQDPPPIFHRKNHGKPDKPSIFCRVSGFGFP
jgi:hypothetical protein